MMKTLAITAALVAALPLSTPADAAGGFDFFLEIEGIKGESGDSKHKDTIDLLGWDWSVSNTGSSIGGGGGGSRPIFAAFSWEQGLDSSFAPLFMGVAEGKHFRSAQLSVRRSEHRDQPDFFKMTFGDVKITSLQTKAKGTGIAVTAALSYDKIDMAYRPQRSDGSLGSEIKGSWNIKEGKPAFSGDPIVVLGLAEAGGNMAFVSGVPEPATWASLAAGLGLVGALAWRRRTAPDVAESDG